MSYFTEVLFARGPWQRRTEHSAALRDLRNGSPGTAARQVRPCRWSLCWWLASVQWQHGLNFTWRYVVGTASGPADCLVLAREVSQCQLDGTTWLSVKAKIARLCSTRDVRFWRDTGGISREGISQFGKWRGNDAIYCWASLWRTLLHKASSLHCRRSRQVPSPNRQHTISSVDSLVHSSLGPSCCLAWFLDTYLTGSISDSIWFFLKKNKTAIIPIPKCVVSIKK